MGAREVGSIEEFLSHKSTEKSGGFLGNWKKREPPKVKTVLHTKIMPVILYRHGGIPRVEVVEKDGESKRVFWSGNWVCPEDEGVLKRMYHREDDGARTVPPRTCGICKFTEAVRALVRAEEILWTDPVLRFVADEETLVLHAGGLWNAFGNKNLTDAHKAQMKKAGISPREAWKENIQPKLNYLFAVVDIDDDAAGVQIAIETSSLGDKVKTVIFDSIDDAKEANNGVGDAGNPALNPFCIQWSYDDTQTEFDKKYKAQKLGSVKVSPKVLELVRGPKPDVSRATQIFNPRTVRALLEKAIDPKVGALLDFNAIFKTNEQLWDEEHGDAEEGDEPAASGERAPEVGRQEAKPKAQEPAAEEADDEVECDECHKLMKLTDPKCPHCGHEYEVEAEEKKPEPPPETTKVRKRSEMKAEREAAAAKEGGKKGKAPF